MFTALWYEDKHDSLEIKKATLGLVCAQSPSFHPQYNKQSKPEDHRSLGDAKAPTLTAPARGLRVAEGTLRILEAGSYTVLGGGTSVGSCLFLSGKRCLVWEPKPILGLLWWIPLSRLVCL